MDSTNMFDSGLEESGRPGRPISTTADLQNANVYSSLPASRENTTTSSPLISPAKRSLSDVPASTSIPYKGTGVLKGTGPELHSTSRHRPRPDVTYNLKALSHQTRSPLNHFSGAAKGLPKHIDLTQSPQKDIRVSPQPVGQELVAITHGRAQQTGDERQPAKRQRMNEDSDASRRSPQVGPWDTASIPGRLASIQHTADSELIEYIWPILLGGGVAKPEELLTLGYFRPFVYLPRKRDVEWNPSSKCDRWSFRNKIDVAALLVQLTGEYAPGCCKRCDSDTGIFKGCVVTASDELVESYYGCANCLYHGRQTFCGFKTWLNRQDLKANAHEHTYLSQQANSGRHLSTQQSASSPFRQSSTSTTSTRDEYVVPMICSACLQAQVTCTHERPSCLRCRLENKQCHYIEKAAAPTVAHQPPLTDAKLTMVQSLEKEEGSQAENHGYIRGTGLLAMEAWERAPGRVRSKVSAKPENIAFSKSYLASGAVVQVCREATFRVEIIRSGHTLRLAGEDNITRICSVATAGKLIVEMEGEDPLVIGPHGMFTVRPRSACVVGSEIYDDVVLHITSIMTE